MEEQWIREIQRKGSRTAADHLIRAHYDEIYRFVYRQTGHKEDAMDLTQSIFLAMLRALPAYRAERGTFRTWLFRIAANKVIDARRRARLTPLPMEELEVPSEEDFAARIRDRALLEQTEDYVSGLEPQVQEEASDTVPEGYVIRQNPVATTEVPNGSTVELWVSTGPESSGEQGEYLIIVPLPTDRDTAVVQIIQDGQEMCNQQVDCSMGNFPFTIYGSGTSQVQVYVDGELIEGVSGEVPFDGI